MLLNWYVFRPAILLGFGFRDTTMAVSVLSLKKIFGMYKTSTWILMGLSYIAVNIFSLIKIITNS